MTRNQLPEGVGKKIVEALKRQAEADITPLCEPENTIGNNIPLTDIQDLPDIGFDDDINDNDILNENTIIEEDPVSVLPLGCMKQKENKIMQGEFEETKQENTKESLVEEAFQIPSVEQPLDVKSQNVQKYSSQQVTQSAMEHQIQEQAQELNQQQTIPPLFQTNIRQAIPQENFNASVNSGAKNNISIPANVAVLKSLIASLPVGVTKQTGAQIIRQTLEAMGIPMNGVLKEAQEVQEELNSSTRECMLRIQEYKTNILQLEQSVQEYQKNITQINDLVSLFLLTDRK